jgi:peptidoglycan/xylan/chitin deacetylase (PgdA/CDA1 family)
MQLSISIDDGHPLDLKVATILLRKQIPAIFYIPIKNIEGHPVLTKKQIKSLSNNFEVGCHGFNHIDLTKVPLSIAKREIKTSKQELENLLGKQITAFAPPKGKYNRAIVKFARSLGFKDLRSARIISFKTPDKTKYVWHPNLHIYPHNKFTDIAHLLKHGDFYSLYRRVKNINTSHIEFTGNLINDKNEVHFWLHSLEIDKNNLWGVLNKL